LSTLKYVCVSDLHLGAAYSVLTFMNPDGTINLLKPSGTLATFGKALRETVRRLSGPELPTLILLGDVLDLGQSQFGAVTQAFKRFIEVLFPADEPPAFASELLTVPGNHDHHLWRSAQDQYYVKSLPACHDAKFIPDLLQHTQLFEPQDITCDLMTEVMHGYAHLAKSRVRVAYPNLGLLDADGRRCVVLHHGHYVDSTYRLSSTISGAFRGGDGRPATVAGIERENGAWVDFLFSGFGSSGTVGKDMVTLYQMLRDAAASHQFSQQLSDMLLDKLSSTLGIGGNSEITHGITVANVLKALVDVTLVRGAESERDSYASVMSGEGVSDVRWYLSGPVRQQMTKEPPKLGKRPAVQELSFVFGHTHKPFQDQLAIAGYSHPVSIYNTGGWVMDQPTMTPTQGAASVFIDDRLNVASLRLFNDPVNGEMNPVRGAGVGGFSDADNPLLTQLNDVLGAATRPLWTAFTEQARVATELHASVQLKKYFTADTDQGSARS
jgi:hypothetical protein